MMASKLLSMDCIKLHFKMFTVAYTRHLLVCTSNLLLENLVVNKEDFSLRISLRKRTVVCAPCKTLTGSD